jgi:hypothetical protein
MDTHSGNLPAPNPGAQPTTPPAPRSNFETDNNSYTGLAFHVITLTAAALRLKYGMARLQADMRANSALAQRTAEMCDQAEVEPRFTSQIAEVASEFTAVATASGDMVSAADVTATRATGFRNAHQNEYGGIYDAVRTSGVRQAKPGFYRTN